MIDTTDGRQLQRWNVVIRYYETKGNLSAPLQTIEKTELIPELTWQEVTNLINSMNDAETANRLISVIIQPKFKRAEDSTKTHKTDEELKAA